MAITIIDHVIAQSANTTDVTISGRTTTGANLIVIALSSYLGSAVGTAPTDNKGNTYTPLTLQHSSANSRVQLFYCFPGANVGASHNFLCTHPYPTMAVLSVAGAAAAGWDKESGGGRTNDGGTTLAPGSATPAEANSLVVTACAAWSSAISGTPPTGFTYPDAPLPVVSGVALGSAYQIQTTIAAVNPLWSCTGASDMAVVLAIFKAAGAAPTLKIRKTLSGLGTRTGTRQGQGY